MKYFLGIETFNRRDYQMKLNRPEENECIISELVWSLLTSLVESFADARKEQSIL